MGVNPTPSNFKTFTFDNTNSAQYGVYITGEGVFNAPERNVEMMEIPGRDGAYALDKGNFNNIEVTYPAGIVADTEADFATAVSNLRNFLCSKSGYCRLTDDYNTGEYRMAIYKSGLEVSHEGLKTGEFDLVFECKPQRWLTSGETKVTVANNGTLTNPTLFASSPQLQTYGYGTINIGGQDIKVDNVTIGDTAVSDGNSALGASCTSTLDLTMLNTGDSITVSGATAEVLFNRLSGHTLTNFSVTSSTNCSVAAQSIGYTATVNDTTFVKGTLSSQTSTVACSMTVDGSSKSVTATITLSYNGTSTLTLSISLSPSSITGVTIKTVLKTPQVFGNSSKSALGSPTYIDLDIGEAYLISNNTAVSVNNAVTIPAELPTLASGNNTITFSNTFTKVDVIPRWWKV